MMSGVIFFAYLLLHKECSLICIFLLVLAVKIVFGFICLCLNWYRVEKGKRKLLESKQWIMIHLSRTSGTLTYTYEYYVDQKFNFNDENKDPEPTVSVA